ncbi:MAG: hypothetical protein ACOH2S_23490 [Janthinobacterium svalbardensis]|uniref:Uncharacterized protein n=1 Tax=Janthinobacterium svalbardensis TaxID=368607 RepID=A0A290WSG4_9BURK|nr:hypothetical protein [Janthinobacterium svalbardensis]ATD59837.1 hypothetical protein CNX70_06270 [Janthinobacterium svalbardensis]
MMNHFPEQPVNKKKAYLLGLLIGFLPILAFFLLLIDHPTELIGIFTGISVPDFNDRPLKIPLACVALCLFLWASFKLQKSGQIAMGEQYGLVFITTLIVVVRFLIFLQQLGQELRGPGW